MIAKFEVFPFSSLPLGVFSSILLSIIWLSPLIEQPGVKWDGVGVAVFSLSAFLELLAEPWWVLGQAHQYVTLKVKPATIQVQDNKTSCLRTGCS